MNEPPTLPEIAVHVEAPPIPPLTVRTFGLTDRGRVRPTNEDQFLIAELSKAMKVLWASLPQPEKQYHDEGAYLFIGPDGIGGRKPGEQASALAVEAIEAFALNTLKW